MLSEQALIKRWHLSKGMKERRVALFLIFCLVNANSSFRSQPPNHFSGKLSFTPHTKYVPTTVCSHHNTYFFVTFTTVVITRSILTFTIPMLNSKRTRFASISFTSASAGLNSARKCSCSGICEVLNIWMKSGAHSEKSPELAWCIWAPQINWPFYNQG